MAGSVSIATITPCLGKKPPEVDGSAYPQTKLSWGCFLIDTQGKFSYNHKKTRSYPI
jgi:hypothetical protein